MHYEGEWRFLTAGLATVRIERAGSEEHVAVAADSSGVVELLYRVQDRFNSYLDSKSLCSYKLLKHTEEGSHRRETVISYDYPRGKAVLEERNLKDNQQKRTENDIPGCVTDVVSGIFYVGSLPLLQGANYTFPLNDGGKTVAVQAHVEGKEQVKTPAGTFQTIRVGPEGDYGQLEEPRPNLDLVHGRRPAPASTDARQTILGDADSLLDEHKQVALVTACGSVLPSAAAAAACRGCHRQIPCRGTWPAQRAWYWPPTQRPLPRLGPALADDRHDHVHHHLQAAQLAAFFFLFLLLAAELRSNLFPSFR